MWYNIFMILLTIALIIIVSILSINYGRATTYIQYIKDSETFAEVVSKYLWHNILRNLKNPNLDAEVRDTLRKGLGSLGTRYPHFITPTVQAEYDFLFKEAKASQEVKEDVATHSKRWSKEYPSK